MGKKDKDNYIIGKLKKEKSSKPFFVFLLFGLLIGICFFLPDIKLYISNSDSPTASYIRKILHEEESNSNTIRSTTTTVVNSSTTTVTTIKSSNNTLKCADKNNNYIYTFDNNKLIKISHEMKYSSADADYNNYLNFAKENENVIKSANYKNTVINVNYAEDSFSYSVNLDLSEYKYSLTYNVNYFDYLSSYEVVKESSTLSGFECK